MFLNPNGGPPERWKSERVGFSWVVAFISAVVVIFGGAYLYNSYESKRITDRQSAILESMGKLTAAQIFNWRKERIQDVNRYVNNQDLISVLMKWMQDPDNAVLTDHLLKMNIVERDSEGFTNVVITGLDGSVLLSTADDRSDTTPEQKKVIQESLSIGRAIMSDPYMDRSSGISIDVVAPIKNHDGKPFAVALMSLDASSSLFQILNFWPTHSASAEALLIKRDGSEVVALTELRHRAGSATKLRLPLDLPDLPSAHAIRGLSGIFEGRDYRGTDVVSYLSRIPDSSWFMVAKIDKSEIYSEAIYRTYVQMVFTVFLILFAVMGITLFFKSRRAVLYQRLYQAEQDRRSADEERKDALQRLALALKGADLGVWDWHVQSGELYQDEVWLAQLGYATEDLATDIVSWESRIHPEDKPEVMKALEECLSGNSPSYSVEHRLRAKGGDWKWILTQGRVLERDAQGQPLRMLGTHLDINKSKMAEEALRNSENMFRALAGAIDDIFWISDPHIAAINYVSPAYEKVWGQKTEDLLKNPQSFMKFICPDDLERVWSLLMSAHEEGREYSVEYRILRPDGTMRWILDRGYPIRDESGKLENMCGTCTDITEIRKAEQALRDREELFRTVFYTSPDAMAISRLNDGVYIDINDSFTELSGFTREDIIGKNSQEFDLWVNENERDHYWLKLLEVGRINNHEARYRLKDGQSRTGLISATVLELNNVPHVLSVVRDIEEMKKAQTARVILATAVDQAAERVLITDPDGRIVYVNPAFELITGFSRAEAVGQAPSIIESGLHDNVFYEKIWQTISAGEVWRGQMINRAKDGALIHEHSTISPVLDDSGAIINYVQIATDITAEESLRHQLAQSQKMEAIGTLAGGIAHDFNNVIQAITGYTELAMDQISPESTPYRNLQKVMSAARRSRDMVRQILAFSRRSQPEQKVFDICPLLKEGLKFLRAAIPSTINIESKVSPKPCRVFADPTQIHQVLMNLCVNASQAITGAKGTITVEVNHANLNEAFTSLHPPLQPGNHVRLEISDDGSGIPPEILGKIFDPYFTTKEAGQGTGLGLSVVHGIVSGCNGAITVAGRPDGGAEFTVYFPEINNNGQASEVEDEPRPVPRGSERILVVDDESVLLEMYERQLNRLGYQVTVSQSAQEALGLLSAKDAFDLVVTDLMMPGISGLDLAREISRKWPVIPVIICTGWSERISEEEKVQANIRAIVVKPALSDEIAFQIRKIIDEQ